jgi:hypothetical protein
MCFVDDASLAVHHVSRRRVLGAGLAVGAALAASGRSLLLPGVAEGAETAPAAGGPGGAGLNFTWFGTNGWEIGFGGKTILFDPWFDESRRPARGRHADLRAHHRRQVQRLSHELGQLR